VERNLEIKIVLKDMNETPTVEIYEPESGDFARIELSDAELETYHSEDYSLKGAIEDMFKQKVADELYGWYEGLYEDLEYEKTQENRHSDIDR
jgi:hypothetical protein